jgi:preprotein translocase subunit SecF
MLNIIRPGSNYDFVGKRFIWLSFSVAAMIGTAVLLYTKGLNYGIDFTGGAEVHVKLSDEWDISKLRTELTEGGLKGIKVQQIGQLTEEEGTHEFMVRAQGEAKGEQALATISDKVTAVLEKGLGKEKYTILKSDIVGPAAGSLLRRNGFLAMFYALLAILIYVGFRFDSRYAPGTVIALFHDSFIVLGILVITGYQFDLTILAAILAIIGYSNNDTIIVFDRVRETLYNHPEYTIEEGVNRSLNETLARTIVTSVTTFFVVLTLFLFGGPVIEGFAFTLLMGVVVGTYSSIFVASPVLIFLTHWKKKRDAKLKASGKHSGAVRGTRKARPEPKLTT